MSEPITREDIAQIYDQIGAIEMRKAQALIKETPTSAAPGMLDRAFEFYHTADLIREIDKMKPLRKDILHPNLYVRAESNLW